MTKTKENTTKLYGNNYYPFTKLLKCKQKKYLKMTDMSWFN